MRHSRRQRRHDPLASAEAVRGVLSAFAREIGTRIHIPPNKLPSLVRAVTYSRRYPERKSRTGRPSRFRDEELVVADQALATVLDRETSGRVSIRSFSDHYLSILRFPPEIESALCGGYINLAEAEQLARLSSRNLGRDEAAASRLRKKILESHVSARSHEMSLRHRVTQALAEAAGASVESAVDAQDDPTGELGETPADHFFLDVLTTIERTIRLLGEGEISTDAQERIYEHGDQILLILRREEAARARRTTRPTRVVI